jgi:transcriptional regulator with XRE-family HTH domain
MRRVTALKLAIVGSGRSQKEIAAELKMSEANLSRIVNGLYCEPETQAKIAAALGHSVVELFGDHGGQVPTVVPTSDVSSGKAAA